MPKDRLCRVCKQYKSDHAFYSSCHSHICKECKSIYYKNRYREKREYILTASRVYAESEAGKQKRNQSSKNRYYGKNHQKSLVRAKLNQKIRSGKIVRGQCAVCGADRAEAHHTDYSKPLEIIWLCKHHHNMVHGGLVLKESTNVQH